MVDNRIPLWGLTVLSTFACVSCGDDFPPYNEVHGFRLLAIAADPPELTLDGAVTFRPLVVGDDAPSFEWSWCAVTSGPGAAHRCAHTAEEIPAPLPSTFLGTSTTATVEWSDDPGSNETLCALAASTPAPADAPRYDCAAERPQIYVRLEVTSSTGERIIALRPLPFRFDGVPNENPTLGGVRYESADGMSPFEDGAVLGAGSTVSLELEVASPEEANEILRATWFVAGGETNVGRTSFIPGDADATPESLRTNTWTLPATGDDAALYVVLRDDRGGTSWLTRTGRLAGGAL